MDFKYKIIEQNNNRYIEIISFTPGVTVLEVPADIEGIPIDGISQVAVVRNPQVHTYILHTPAEDFSLAKFILNNSSQSLRILFRNPDGDYELAFPGYNDRSVEDTMARAIHLKIDGSGYAYRECVFRDHIDFAGYDALFKRVLAEGGNIVFDIAVSRLMHPIRLEENAALNYESYIRDNGKEVLNYLISVKDKKRLSFLLDRFKFEDNDLEYALRHTSAGNFSELTSIIMEKGFKR